MKHHRHTLLALAASAALVYLWWKLEETAPVYQAETGTAPPTTDDYDQVLGNGGLPIWGPMYWGANAPVAQGSTFNINIDPDFLAETGNVYLPLFGFVGISTPDITSGP